MEQLDGRVGRCRGADGLLLDGCRSVEHEPDEPLDRLADGLERLDALTHGGLRADTGHRDGDRDALEQLAEPVEPGREVGAERVGQRDDEVVELLVDALGVALLGPHALRQRAVGDELGALDRERLPDRVLEEVVAAVAVEDVLRQRGLRDNRGERVLA